MIEEVKVNVVRRRPRVLAGLGTSDYVTLCFPSVPSKQITHRIYQHVKQKGE